MYCFSLSFSLFLSPSFCLTLSYLRIQRRVECDSRHGAFDGLSRRVNIYENTHIYIYVYVSTYVYIYKCVYIYMCVRICTCASNGESSATVATARSTACRAAASNTTNPDPQIDSTERKRSFAALLSGGGDGFGFAL